MSRANPRYHRVNPFGNAIGVTNGCVMYGIWGTIEGKNTLSTYHLVAANPAPTPTQLATLLTAISGSYFASYKACLSSDWTAVRETLTVVHRNDLLGTSSVVHTGNVGGRPAGHVPTEVAQVGITYTALKGQRGRGRMSLPAISTTDVTASSTNGGNLTATNALASALLGTCSDGTNVWSPCVATRSAASPRLVVYTSLITSVKFSPILGTIRNRKV